MIDDNNEYERAKVFLKRKTTVHVSKKDGFFYNGLILEVANYFFIILDRKLKKEFLVLFSELKKPIAKFTEVCG